MTVKVTNIATPSVSIQLNGTRQYFAIFKITISSNTYTSRRYVHYKVISDQVGSVYGGYITLNAKQNGSYTKNVVVNIPLETFCGVSTVSEKYIVYTYITTSIAQPGSSGWINKGTSTTAHLEGATAYTFYYYDRFGQLLNQEQTYEYNNYSLYNPSEYLRYNGWYLDQYKTGTKYLPSRPLSLDHKAGTRNYTYNFYLSLSPVRIRIKINDEWKVGELYIKPRGRWEESISAYIKVNDEWKEIDEIAI